MENVKLLQELGYEVHYASNFKNPHYGTDNQRLKKTGIQNHQIDFVRSPYHFWKNLKAYHQLVRLFLNAPLIIVKFAKYHLSRT